MALKVLEKPKVKGGAQATKTNIAQLVDEYAETEAQVKKLMADPAMARFEELKKLVQEAGAGSPPEEKVILQGSVARLILGPKAKERKIKDTKAALAALKKAVGQNVWSLVKVGLGQLDAYLTPDEVAELVDEGQTGRRHVETIIE